MDGPFLFGRWNASSSKHFHREIPDAERLDVGDRSRQQHDVAVEALPESPESQVFTS